MPHQEFILQQQTLGHSKNLGTTHTAHGFIKGAVGLARSGLIPRLNLFSTSFHHKPKEGKKMRIIKSTWTHQREQHMLTTWRDTNSIGEVIHKKV